MSIYQHFSDTFHKSLVHAFVLSLNVFIDDYLYNNNDIVKPLLKLSFIIAIVITLGTYYVEDQLYSCMDDFSLCIIAILGLNI